MRDGEEDEGWEKEEGEEMTEGGGRGGVRMVQNGLERGCQAD